MPLPTCKDCTAPAKHHCDCIKYTGEPDAPPKLSPLRLELQEANKRNASLMADLQDAKREIKRIRGLLDVK